MLVTYLGNRLMQISPSFVAPDNLASGVPFAVVP